MEMSHLHVNSWVKIQMKCVVCSEPDFPPFHSRLTWFQLSIFHAFCSLSHCLFLPFTYSSSNSTLRGKKNGERRSIPSMTSFCCHGAVHCALPTPACIFCHQPFSCGSRSPEKDWKELHCISAGIVLHCILMITSPGCIEFWLPKWDFKLH